MAIVPSRARLTPRISANDLALFMISSDTARRGIIKRAKFPQSPPIFRYISIREPICQYLADPVHRVNPLIDAEVTLQQRIDDTSTGPLARDDAAHSIEVLHAIQNMRNQISAFDFQPAPQDQAKLSLGGVEVSVRADLLVHGSSRGVEQIGAAVLRMTMDDAETETEIERRRNMGLYVATLARMHVDQNIITDRSPVNRLCLSIDIQHGEVFVAPNANARRVNDMENACLTIAAIWPTIIR